MDNKVKEYIEACLPEKQSRLKELYKTIDGQLPSETEVRIAWGMPSFYLNGYIVHFSSQKKHIGFHVGTAAIEHFKDELSEIPKSKGTIRLMDDKALPLELIEKVVEFCLKENLQK